MAQAMEHNNGIPGMPGLILLGIGVSSKLLLPETVSGWVQLFSFVLACFYYLYKIYNEHKQNKRQ